MSQSGSVPMSLHGSQTNVYQGDELETERKNELTHEVVGLLKKKNDLVLEVRRLIKTQEELVANEETHRKEMKELREKEFAAYEEEKSLILEKQRIRERELDGRDQKLGDALSELLDIYEYLDAVQDDLVWESSQNDAREAELEERRRRTVVREKMVDFNSDKAEKLVKEAQMTLNHANEQAELVLKEKKRWEDEKLIETKKVEAEKERLNEKERLLNGRVEMLNEKEKSLIDREKVVGEKEAQFAKANEVLAEAERIRIKADARLEYLENQIKIVGEQKENLAARARSLR